MKIENNYANYFIIITMFCILFSGITCTTSRQIKELVGVYERHPVFEKSLPWQDPRLTKLERISHAFCSSTDTFVVTLIDMNENKSFIDSKDVVVISTLTDSVAPIIPANNSNATYFRTEIIFDFYGTKYRLSHVSSDGEEATITKIKSDRNIKIQAIVTDQLAFELKMNEIKSNISYNLREVIQEQSKKYILLDFWLPSCIPCFENIPKLRQLEKSGVGIVNLFHIGDDEIKLVEKDISKFDIPGINFRSSPGLIKFFSQNGFPFYVLIDVPENRIVLKSHRIGEIAKYLN